MTMQGVDVAALVSGISRIEEERAEIHLVVRFLTPYFAKLAQREILLIKARKRLELTLPSSTPMSFKHKGVFDIKNVAWNALRFDLDLSETESNSSIRYDLWYVPGNDESGSITLLTSIDGAIQGPYCGKLRIDLVGPCHALLKPLLEYMLVQFPGELQEHLNIFYNAARRRSQNPASS